MGIRPQDHIGRSTGEAVVEVERGPVTNFALALEDDHPVRRRADAAREAGFDHIPAPPTYGVAMAHWGRFPEDQPQDDATEEGSLPARIVQSLIAERGGLMLHGEQGFVYHRPLVVGDRLHRRGRIVDVYEKESKGTTMTFVVQEDEYRDAEGELVLTTRLNLIHRG